MKVRWPRSLLLIRSAPEFKDNLADRTKRDYNKVFDYLSKVDDLTVEEMVSADMYTLRDKALKRHKRRFANYVVQVIRLLLKWGKPRGYITQNVAEGIELIPRPKNMKRANRSWTDEERDVVLDAAPIQLRLMIAVPCISGLERVMHVRSPKQPYDGQLFEAIASKNGETVWMPAHYRFREITAEAFKARQEAQAKRTRRRKVVPLDPPTLAVTSRGTPWTESGFRASFFKLIRKLVKDGKVAPGLTFHGLRHTLGKQTIRSGAAQGNM